MKSVMKVAVIVGLVAAIAYGVISVGHADNGPNNELEAYIKAMMN